MESDDRVEGRPLLGNMLLKYDNSRRNSFVFIIVGTLFFMSSSIVYDVQQTMTLLGLSASGIVTGILLGILAWNTKRKIAETEPLCTGTSELGPLMVAVDRCSDSNYVINIARRALLNLLPMVRREDANTFNRQERDWMNRQLGAATRGSFPGDISIVKAILAALAVVGTVDEVPFVESLARKPIKDHFQEAAAAWLPAIRECAIRIRNETTLLRASRDPEESLLRPAVNAAEEALLRPALQDDATNVQDAYNDVILGTSSETPSQNYNKIG